MIENLLVPERDGDSAPFWEGCERSELRVQACGRCGRMRFPPRPMCPWCQSFEHEWKAVSGTATVWSFVVAHPPLLPAYQEFAPYNVVVVELDEDPSLRMVGNLVASEHQPINSVDPYSIRIGDAVRVVFASVGEGDDAFVLPRWVRA